MNKVTITVGIPVYNEEANIRNLLCSVLSQKRDGFILKEIIVVDDGSTDKTAELVEKTNDKRIRLIKEKTRKGQINAQNKIFSLADTDAVVLFEADSLPTDNLYIKNLVANVLRDYRVGLVQGNPCLIRPSKFLGRVIKKQTDIFNGVSLSRGPSNWIASGDGGRLFTKIVYKNLTWPANVPEDSYALLWCKAKGIKTVFERSASCHYGAPETFEDLLKATTKIVAGRKKLEKHFSKEQVDKIYNRKTSSKTRMFLRFLLSNPIILLYYLYLRIKLSMYLKDEDFTDFWDISETTKSLKGIKYE